DPDPAPLMEAAGGDRALFARLVETFLRDADKHVTSFRAATETGDAHAARRRMHQLFGAAAMVGAPGLAAIARNLHDGSSDASLPALEAELARVTSSLRALLDH